MATSKQPKQPAFPHPALEVGVAQYPTPLVPNYNDKKGGWSINDQGHIILVEKISIEKGNFTPLPLDGSVTYTGRDANKWPSTLYLVAEKPTPDGEYCYRYWANDRSLSSQDLWNYGLDYSANNPNYPITSRTYIVPRSQYSTISLGSIDPVFGGSQIISQQKMVELPEDNPLASRYVAVQRVYETIPGPVITGKRLDNRGDIETINVQTVVAGTTPAADGLFITETKVDPVDSVKSTKTTASVESYATLTTKQNKAGLLGDTSTTDDIVSPSTEPDALSTTVLESSVEQITATKAKKRTTTSSGPTELDSKEKKAGLLGETTIVQSIVSYGSSPDDLSTSIISSSVDAIDVYKSKKTTITASGPTELDGATLQEFGVAITTEKIVSYGSSPTVDYKTIKSEVSPIDSAKSKLIQVDYSSPSKIIGHQYDEFFDTNLTISKQIVDSSEQPITASTIHSQSTDPYLLSYKDEPINPYQNQRIIVTAPVLPPTRTEYKTGTFTSPLLVFSQDINYADLSCVISGQPFFSDVRIKITPNTRASQSRQTIFKTVTSYSYGPPEAQDTDILSPALSKIAYTGYIISFDYGAGLCDRLMPNTTTYPYGVPAHYCQVNGTAVVNVYEQWDIPATSPSATTYLSYVGTYKKISWKAEYWKANIWQAQTIYCLIP